MTQDCFVIAPQTIAFAKQIIKMPSLPFQDALDYDYHHHGTALNGDANCCAP
ncbi:hypothetical protein ACWWJF_12775 [Symbiopectobacterium sp. Eva_TO]